MTSSNSNINNIKRYISEYRLHPHDTNDGIHDFICGYDGKSFICYAGDKEKIIEQMSRHPVWFTWGDEEKRNIPIEEGKHLAISEFRIVIKYRELIPCLLWIFSPKCNDDEEPMYYLTDTLLFRCEHNPKRWRVLPDS